MTQHTLEIDGLQMVYTDEGDKDAPPLFMIHGWGSFKGVWRTTSPTLKQHFRCIAVDLIGFGESDIPNQVDVTIPTQAKRIIALIDALGYEKVHLIGHSMGGQIAFYIASQLIPNRIEKLVNVSGCCHGKLTDSGEAQLWILKVGRLFPPYFAMARLWCHTKLYTRMYCSHWMYDIERVPHDTWRDDRASIVRPKSERSMYPAWEAITACDLTDSLPQITAPTLTIFGKQDDVVPIEAGQIAETQIPNHQMVWLDECGHFPMYEQTEHYLDALRAFLF